MSKNNGKTQKKQNCESSSSPDSCYTPCNVCERDIVRTAITVNGIKICHNCLKFFQYQAKLNNRTWEEELEYQTKYMVEGV